MTHRIISGFFVALSLLLTRVIAEMPHDTFYAANADVIIGGNEQADGIYNLEGGHYLLFRDVDFGLAGVNNLTVNAEATASNSKRLMFVLDSVRLDQNGKVVLYDNPTTRQTVDTNSLIGTTISGKMTTFSWKNGGRTLSNALTDRITGVHDLYVVPMYSAEGGISVFWFKFDFDFKYAFQRLEPETDAEQTFHMNKTSTPDGGTAVFMIKYGRKILHFNDLDFGQSGMDTLVIRMKTELSRDIAIWTEGTDVIYSDPDRTITGSLIAEVNVPKTWQVVKIPLPRHLSGFNDIFVTTFTGGGNGLFVDWLSFTGPLPFVSSSGQEIANDVKWKIVDKGTSPFSPSRHDLWDNAPNGALRHVNALGKSVFALTTGGKVAHGIIFAAHSRSRRAYSFTRIGE
ncbi:MAG: hypothetical protein GF398_16880 [Chitinivibrionales bacterium]|nr:hypothetical protein [Chitinivibrionales bacterium]